MRELLRRLRFLFTRNRVRRELDEELTFHLDMAQHDLRDDGLSPREAEAAARRRLGSPLRIRERGIDVWIWQPLESTLQDLRFAWRMIRKQPVFTLVAASTLAIGIGANTALFTFVDTLLLRLPGVSRPESLVWMFTTSRDRPFNQWSYQTYLDVRTRTEDVFSGVAAYSRPTITMTIGDVTETAMAEIVTANFFDVLGVRPALGRGFVADDDRAPTPVAILGDRLWRERFSADPGIIGRSVPINGQAFTIVGVAPASFTGLMSERVVDAWVPMSMQPLIRPPSAGLRRVLGTTSLLGPRAPAWLSGVARLRSGVTANRAQAAVVAIGHQLAREFPDRNPGAGLNVGRLKDGPNVDPNVKRGITVLFTIVGLVLLIACANVANLALARSSARVREIAVRLALGISRGRLLRQLLTEHVVLAIIGGVLGFALAAWLVRLIPTLLPPGPIGDLRFDLKLDQRVLLFTTALSLITGVVFGLLPALAASRQDLVSTIREGSSQAGTSRSRVRRTLVVAQVALSLLLLIAAGLFIRGLQKATEVDPGFDRRARVLLGNLEVRTRAYSDEQTYAFTRALLDRLRAQPGVQSASLSHTLPLGWSARSASILSEEGRAAGPDARGLDGDVNAIDAAYFDALGIRIVKGRSFTAQDRQGSPGVVIINDVLASQLWPSQNPIGRRLTLQGANGPLREVVGVVPNGRYRSLSETPRPYAYIPYPQGVETIMSVYVRTTGDPVAFASTLRREVSALDPYIPLSGVRTLDEHMQLALWFPRMSARIIGVFGLVAMALSALGLYGVMAHAVAQRTREIGVRVALGASRERLLLLVLRDAARLTIVGLVLGTGAALALTGVLAAGLYGISPRDPIAFVSMALLLLLVSLIASIVPARRAMRVDPIQALRLE